MYRSILRAVALIALLCTNLTPAAQAKDFITILTGGTSGIYYPLGVALSRLYTQALPEASVTVQSTKGSVANLNLLQKQRGELAFSLGDAVVDAWHGNAKAGFPKKLNRLRMVAGIYSNYIQIVARADSGIHSLADLKGKRISVGAPKSGTELNARRIFKAAGLSYKDFAQVQYLPFGESVQLMKNHQLDVTLQSAGLGVSSIRDLAATNKIVIVPIPKSVVEKTGNPAYRSDVIPAGTYDGQDKAVPTVAIQNFLITRAGVSDADVYAMTKALFTHRDQLIAAHNAAKGITLSHALLKTPLPLHPGAAKYYREVGLLK